MLRKEFLILVLFVMPLYGNANVRESITADTLFVTVEKMPYLILKDTCELKGKTRGEALFWWALGGVVGLHRIYLGTSPVVPVFYALTLGGGMGLLAVTDLVLIIFVKDINRFADNPGILMWMKDETKKPPSAD
jgi:hypothetical protein